MKRAWLLLIVLLAVTVTLGVLLMQQFKPPERVPTPAATTAPIRAKPLVEPATMRFDMREDAVRIARSRDKVGADRIVGYLVQNGMKIEPGGKYLMRRADWASMNHEQKVSMATVFLMHNDLRLVRVADLETGELLGEFGAKGNK